MIEDKEQKDFEILEKWLPRSVAAIMFTLAVLAMYTAYVELTR